jgi:hypothetical protein
MLMLDGASIPGTPSVCGLVDIEDLREVLQRAKGLESLGRME